MKRIFLMLSLLFSSTAFSQYTLQDMESICAQEFSESQVLACTHSQRVNLGLFATEQLKPLIRLQTAYRDTGKLEKAANLIHQMKEIVRHSSWEGLGELTILMLWMPDDRSCFERDDWQYTEWSNGCPELRYYIADNYIMATRIAELLGDAETVAALAEYTAVLTFGIQDEPLYLFNGDYNTLISPDYRADYWMKKSQRNRRAADE